MSLNVGTIFYEVNADTSKLVNADDAADASLDRLQKGFRQTDVAAAKTQGQMTRTAQAVKTLGEESSRASRPLDGMTKLLAGLVSARAVLGLVQMAEAYNEMSERIKFATSSQDEFEHVQQRLLATANGTYRAMSEAQEVYILTADSLRALGYTTDQVLDITDSMAYSFVKNATSVERAENATRAYTNAINKGKVESDGWMTIVSAIPTIVQDVANATGKTAEEVRQLGATGKLTAQQLNEGLRRSLEANKEAADGMATTLRDAFTNIRNNLAVYLGGLNEATGATTMMSSAMIQFGNNIETVAKLLAAAAAGGLAMYIAKIGASILETGKAMIAARALAAEQLVLARSHAQATALALAHAQANAGLTGSHAAVTTATAANTAAQARLAAATAATSISIRGALTLLGGPAGLIFLLGSAASAIFLFGENAKKAVPSLDELSGAIDKLGESKLALRAQQVSEAISNIEKKAAEAGSTLSGMEKDYAALQKQVGKGVSAADLENVNKALVEQRAAQESANEELGRARDLQKQIAAEQAKRSGAPSAPPPGAPAAKGDPEVAKRLAAMKEELELTRLTGVAKAKLQAIQKLGENASAAERAEAEKLAAEIYRLEQSRIGAKKAAKVEDQAESKKLIADLEKIKNANQEAVDEYSNTNRILEALRSAAMIDERSYYRQKFELMQNSNAEQEDALEKQIARMRQEKLTDNEQIDHLKKIEEAESELRRLRSNAAAEIMIHMIQQEDALNKIQQKYEAVKAAADGYVRSIQNQNDRELGGMGRGSQQREVDDRFSTRTEEFENKRRSLAQDFSTGEITKEQYDSYLQIQQDAYNRALEADAAYWSKKKELESNFFLGAKEALTNYFEETQNVYKQTEGIVTNMIKGMEDALVSFVRTGKLDFRSLADSIIADISRMIIKQQIMGPLSQMMSNGAGAAASGGGWGAVLGAIFAGNRAGGGSAQAFKAYRINELGRPEVFNDGVRQYMIPTRNGKVEPQTSTNNSQIVNVSVAMPKEASRSTALQFGNEVGRQISLASMRNG